MRAHFKKACKQFCDDPIHKLITKVQFWFMGGAICGIVFTLVCILLAIILCL
jgi:hypothetical protein